jgi:DNA-binding MarR family transcriptional regulator
MSITTALLPFARLNEREINCNALVVFLTIAESGEHGVKQADLALRLRIAKSSVSRNCGILGLKTQKNKDGLGLIKVEPWPKDPRINLLSLTDKGKDLYETMTAALP